MKKLLLIGTLIALSVGSAYASVRIDVKNESSEDCSLAINARTDKTKWLTEGWYVFASGEEAPIILDAVNDVHNVYVYNDCTKDNVPKGSETKKVWVKTNLKFSDEVPRDNQQGYEEVTFVRLTSGKYTISAN
jgi:uncharacterized membrane protein